MADNTHNFPLHEPAPEKPNSKANKAIGLSILGAFALVLALIGIDVGIINAVQRPPARPIIEKKEIKVTGTDQVASTVYVSLAPEMKPGPDGKLHDAFSVTSYTVHVGKPVKLVINNTDDVPHSIFSPSAGVNIVVKPGTHSYTLLVKKSGVFQWWCNYPCDPFSMMHNGYMRGTITATSSV